MSFLEHLDELRKRIVRSCIAIAVCVVAVLLVLFAHVHQTAGFPRSRVLDAIGRRGQADAIDNNI